MLDEHTKRLSKLLHLHIEASKNLIVASRGTIKALKATINILDPPSNQPSGPHPVDHFLDDNMVQNDGRFPSPKGSSVYHRYRLWATDQDCKVLSARAFHCEMRQRGYERRKKTGIDIYSSIAMLPS